MRVCVCERECVCVCVCVWHYIHGSGGHGDINKTRQLWSLFSYSRVGQRTV